jgi:hypothetical protein
VTRVWLESKEEKIQMRPRRDPSLPVGIGEPDIPYDRSSMGNEGISGIPAATGGLKSMKLDFSDGQQAPQIPPGAGVPPAGMQGGIPPAGMQAPPQQGMGQEQGAMAPLLAGMGGPPPQQGMDTSGLSDQDLMMMADEGSDIQGQQMFDASMQDPQIQQQLLLAARRQQMGGGGF